MWYIILFILTLALDQISKIVCDSLKTDITVIEGIFSIEIAYNRGASFSFLANKEWAQTFFIILTIVVLTAGIIFVLWKKPKGKWLNTSIALMFSGTIGNFIDRLAFGYVRDFINVHFFANFNIADSCLCVGAFMLIFYVLFLDNDPIFKIGKKKQAVKEENDG
ncbi:MAG: signal peptidase II [Clostridia bacterium]|nr:signal peptidase II [Clostridia bacterium]